MKIDFIKLQWGEPSLSSYYSSSFIQKVINCRHLGFFTPEEGRERGMRCVFGSAGELDKGYRVGLYFLVDESDGVIADAKFQAFGPSILIGIAQIACEFLIRKNYDQALRMKKELLEKKISDDSLPQEGLFYLDLVIDAIKEAAKKCLDIPFEDLLVSTPLEKGPSWEGVKYSDWRSFGKKEKIAAIEEVIQEDIRPYIELDAGGIEIMDLTEDLRLTIAYKGACTSCHSATGSTLDAIQGILRSKIDPQILVVPDASFLA